MRRITMREVWRWRGDHENLYLDASCLTYGFGDDALARPPLATIDYSSMRSVTGAASSGGGYRSNRGGGVAITHSGDVIDGGRREGKADRRRPARAERRGRRARLHDERVDRDAPHDRPPEVRCVDADDRSGEPLATYELEGRPTGSHTAVIMCRVWRPAIGATWRVQAVGELCYGSANGPNDTRGYAAIHEAIAKIGARGA